MNEPITIPIKISPYAYAGMTENVFGKPKLTITNPGAVCDNIAKAICKIYSLDVEQLKEKNRTRSIVKIKQIIIWVLCSKGITTMVIGKYFNQDHTTIIHSRETVNDLAATDEDYKKELRYVLEHYK